VCAALSLAVHLGLAFGGIRLPRAPLAPPTGAGSTAPEANASAALGGETFDIQDEAPPIDEATAAEEAQPSPATPSPPIELDDGPAQQAPRPPSSARRSPAPAARTSPTAAAAAPAQLYGAAGDRSASDLVTAFRRNFANAASPDPIWETVPVGFYTEGTVTFTLSEEGSLTHTTISANAAPAFRSAIGRIVALLKARAFTARGMKTRLHIVLRVTDKVVNNGAFTVNAEGSFETPSRRHVGAEIIER
jgi:hypothetical protein